MKKCFKIGIIALMTFMMALPAMAKVSKESAEVINLINACIKDVEASAPAEADLDARFNKYDVEFEKYKNSTEKLTSEDKKALADAFIGLFKIMVKTAVISAGLDYNSPQVREVLKSEVLPMESKYRNAAAESTTLGDFFERMEIIN